MPRNRGAQQGRRLTRSDIPTAELASRYTAGETLVQLAAAYSCSTMTVVDRLHRAGIEPRSRGYRAGSVRIDAETTERAS